MQLRAGSGGKYRKRFYLAVTITVRKSKKREGTINCPFLSYRFHTAGATGSILVAPTITFNKESAENAGSFSVSCEIYLDFTITVQFVCP